jgi:septal ring-binding cell division protein DamX
VASSSNGTHAASPDTNRDTDVIAGSNATVVADLGGTGEPHQVQWAEVPAVFRQHREPVDSASRQEVVSIPEVACKPSLSRRDTVRSADWVLMQNTGDYTLQLGTSLDRELLLSSTDSIPADYELAIYVFKRTPSGRPMYGLSVNTYATAWEALRAINSLPDDMKTYRPMVRKFGDLHKKIRQHQ